MPLPVLQARAIAAGRAISLTEGATDVPVASTLEVHLGARVTDLKAILYDARERPLPGSANLDVGAETRIVLAPERLSGSSRYRLEISAERGDHLTGEDGKAFQDLSLVFQTAPAPPEPRKRRSRN